MQQNVLCNKKQQKATLATESYPSNSIRQKATECNTKQQNVTESKKINRKQ